MEPRTGTTVLAVIRTADPVRTAVLDMDLPPTEAGALARLISRSGWNGSRADLCRELRLSPRKFRTVLGALEARGLAVQTRKPVGDGWAWPIAVTDTPGTLPDPEELRAQLAHGLDTQTADDWSSTTTIRGTMRPFPSHVPTSSDAVNPQVATCDGNRHLTGSLLPPSGAKRGADGGRAEPVALSPAADAQQPAPRPRYGVAVISTFDDLAALAKRPVRPRGDGREFVTSRQVWEAARTMDLDVVDASLATLAAFGLPFWVAPHVWPLMERGWTPDRVAERIASTFHEADAPDRVAVYRLRQSLAELVAAETAAGPQAPAQAPEPAPAAAPVVVEEMPAPQFHAEGAPWDLDADEREREREERPAQPAFGGRRTPMVPKLPTYQEVQADQDRIREESGDPGTFTPEFAQTVKDWYRSARAAGVRTRDGVIRIGAMVPA